MIRPLYSNSENIDLLYVITIKQLVKFGNFTTLGFKKYH